MSQQRKPMSRDQGVKLGIIVTPMLDMAFQILAFFIMTYHPSALEANVPGSLTPANPLVNSPNQALNPDLAADSTLLDDLKDAPTIHIKAIAKGQEVGNRTEGFPRQLLLKLPLEVEAILIADVDFDFDVALKQLDTRLKDLIRTDTIGKTHIKIAADGELRQQHFIKVYDVARRAGFEQVHFVPPAKLN